MSSNIPTNVPFLRTSRNFPQEAQPLSVEINRMYNDVATATNLRTIGIFSTDASITNGENWFVNSSQPNQVLRRLYTFTSFGNIPHNLNFALIVGIVKIYGTFTDSTNPLVQKWYPIPYVSTPAGNNQVAILVDPTNIVITAGGGAPAIVQGYCVLEWLSNV